MCKYCKGNFLDNKDILNKTASLGHVGNMILETKIDKDDKSGRRQLSTKVTILTHGCMSDYMETYKRNINYCPFCGRKLETEDTQDEDKIDCSKGCLNCINRGCCDYEHINKVDLSKQITNLKSRLRC